MNESSKTKPIKLYQITFPGNEVYVGQTRRSLAVRYRNGKGYQTCPMMNAAIQKYLEKDPNFKPQMEVLMDNLTQEEADTWEKNYIRHYEKPTSGGKIVLNMDKGGYSTKIRSEEFKEKMRGKNTVKVRKFSVDGEYICTYDSISGAAEDNNLDLGNIEKAMSGKYLTCGGFRWHYDDGKTYPIIQYGNNVYPEKEEIKQYDLRLRPKYKFINAEYVLQKDKDTDQIIAVYPSIGEASSSTGISKGSITACTSGFTTRGGDYKWERYQRRVQTAIYE